MKQTLAIPMQFVGPMRLRGKHIDTQLTVPLATFEKPLWASVHRGALVSRQTDGIWLTVVSEGMTRSIVVAAPSAQYALDVAHALEERKTDMENVVRTTSRFAQLVDCQTQLVGRLLYLRFKVNSGDASGHNMATKAADALMPWLLQEYSQLEYVSISANACTDKKVSAVNGLLGRGRHVIAEITIPADVCTQYLKTTPEKIVDLNYKKNWVGSTIAGSLRSANAHFANMLLGIYLACGQDAANIVEGSQGFTTAEVINGALYFAVTCPNLIVGTVGNGKDLPQIQDNLTALGCMQEAPPGENARRFACIVAATVLCGELSLLAAQTIPGELMRTHEIIERKYVSNKG
ncbi:MAG: hydroxymethylglutaryl-CoA reductase (NADPH) [Gammaproteobacteria bacterium]